MTPGPSCAPGTGSSSNNCAPRTTNVGRSVVRAPRSPRSWLAFAHRRELCDDALALPPMHPTLHALIERNLAILFAAGFSVELAHHALHVLDSRIFGFSAALFDETGRPQPSAQEQAALVQALASYPSVARLAGAVSHDGPLGACDDDIEFAFGLDLILDGLERVGTS